MFGMILVAFLVGPCWLLSSYGYWLCAALPLQLSVVVFLFPMGRVPLRCWTTGEP